MGDRQRSIAGVVAQGPLTAVRADLVDATDEQLRVIADGVEAERDRSALRDFVDASEA